MPFRPEVYRQSTWRSLGLCATKEQAREIVMAHQSEDGPYKFNRVRIATLCAGELTAVSYLPIPKSVPSQEIQV